GRRHHLVRYLPGGPRPQGRGGEARVRPERREAAEGMGTDEGHLELHRGVPNRQRERETDTGPDPHRGHVIVGGRFPGADLLRPPIQADIHRGESAGGSGSASCRDRPQPRDLGYFSTGTTIPRKITRWAKTKTRK